MAIVSVARVLVDLNQSFGVQGKRFCKAGSKCNVESRRTETESSFAVASKFEKSRCTRHTFDVRFALVSRSYQSSIPPSFFFQFSAVILFPPGENLYFLISPCNAFVFHFLPLSLSLSLSPAYFALVLSYFLPAYRLIPTTAPGYFNISFQLT